MVDTTDPLGDNLCCSGRSQATQAGAAGMSRRRTDHPSPKSSNIRNKPVPFRQSTNYHETDPANTRQNQPGTHGTGDLTV